MIEGSFITPEESLSPSPQKGVYDSSPSSQTDSPCSSSSQQEKKEPIDPSVMQYMDGFDIKDPLELLYLLDDDVRTGKTADGKPFSLYKWQIQFLTDFADSCFNDDNPFQAIVRACNGSGKDKYVIAPCVVWLCMRFKLARGIVTSSSGVQLDNQTDAYIEMLCKSANRKWAGGKELVWKCNYRRYECLPTESPILLFATDESGKAEGFHPLGSGRKMGIFESEAKSVPDDIYIAQNKCTGYTHRAIVSTPGLPMGHFFNLDAIAVDRKMIGSVSELKSGDYVKYHITAYDCQAHISKAYIEQMKRDLPGGESGAAFKSQVLAEFGTTDEMVVISYSHIWQSFKHPPLWIPESYNRGGLDLAGGGAENVLVVRNGNKILKVLAFRFDDTEDTIDYLEEKFKEHALNHKDALVFGDCCGIGEPMLRALRRRGWSNIRLFDSRNASHRPKVYKNIATEMWFKVNELLQQRELVILDDALLIRQLSTRYYKIGTNNVHQLLSKLEQRSRGYPSPDRADALVYSLVDYKSTYQQQVLKDIKAPFDVPVEKRDVGTFVQKTTRASESLQSFHNTLRKNRDQTLYLKQIENYNKQIRLSRVGVTES